MDKMHAHTEEEGMAVKNGAADALVFYLLTLLLMRPLCARVSLCMFVLLLCEYALE